MRAVKIGIRGYRHVRSESGEKEIVHVELAGKPEGCARCGSVQIVGKGRYQARRVLDALEEILVCSGRKPENVRSDNGPEFVAKRVHQWAETGQVGLRYIEPGSPWENRNVENFHASLRAELLDRELFFSVAEANAMLADWREEYNFKRPHGSLGYRAPAEAAKRELALRATPCAPVHAGNPTLNQ